MAFKKTAELGYPDPNVNRLGRIKREKPLNRELKDRYLLELLRKLRPGQALAIQRTLKIIGDKDSADANAIKASALVMRTYASLIKELYGTDEVDEDEDSVEALQEDAPKAKLFSLTMIKNNEPVEE